MIQAWKMQDDIDINTTTETEIRRLTEMQRLQLLLAEQRTSLSLLRTGIAIFTLPLSVLTVLIATSKNYKIMDILYLIVPTGMIIIGLIVFAVWMISRAMRQFFRIRSSIEKLKEKDEFLRGIL